MEENNYAELSEMIYNALHSTEENKVIFDEESFYRAYRKATKAKNDWIVFNLAPLLDQALDTKDREWFDHLMELQQSQKRGGE